jgi:hypothetical protein
MCVEESCIWLYVYCEKHVPRITMGRGEYLLFASWQRVFHLHLHPAGAENENLDLVERLGIIGDARRMDVMVGAKKKIHPFTHQIPRRAMILFLSAILSFVWRTTRRTVLLDSSTWRSSSVRSSYRDYIEEVWAPPERRQL